MTAGNGKGEKYRGIYKFADGKLVMCFPNDVTKDRPKEFTSPDKSGRLVYTLDRKK